MTNRYSLFIDGQNVAAKYIEGIIKYCSSLGCKCEQARLYASNDQIGKLFRSHGTLLEDNDIDAVPVRCKPKKNSVDIRIAVDIVEQAWEDEDGDLIILATDDSDFTHVASKIVSYGTGFHLLHVGDKPPAGYSPKIITHRLVDERGTRRKIVDKVKNVAELIPGRNAVKSAITVLVPPAPEPPQPYTVETPLAALNKANFCKRLRECSPIVTDTRAVFGAVKDQTGQRWKSERSKKTAQAFCDEMFGAGLYAYEQWTGQSPNSGYFVSGEVRVFSVTGGAYDPLVPLVGTDRDLVRRQSEILAAALNEASYPDFNSLYDARRDDHVMPRYAAWAILSCWLARHGGAKRANIIGQDGEVDGEAMTACFFQALRQRFEDGAITLEMTGPGRAVA